MGRVVAVIMVTMAVCVAVTVTSDAVEADEIQLAVADAPLCRNGVGELAHIVDRSPQNDRLHTTLMVEMTVHARHS